MFDRYDCNKFCLSLFGVFCLSLVGVLCLTVTAVIGSV